MFAHRKALLAFVAVFSIALALPDFDAFAQSVRKQGATAKSNRNQKPSTRRFATSGGAGPSEAQRNSRVGTAGATQSTTTGATQTETGGEEVAGTCPLPDCMGGICGGIRNLRTDITTINQTIIDLTLKINYLPGLINNCAAGVGGSCEVSGGVGGTCFTQCSRFQDLLSYINGWFKTSVSTMPAPSPTNASAMKICKPIYYRAKPADINGYSIMSFWGNMKPMDCRSVSAWQALGNKQLYVAHDKDRRLCPDLQKFERIRGLNNMTTTTTEINSNQAAINQGLCYAGSY